jgi:hypothetical protein
MVISMHLNGDKFGDANLVRMHANYKFSSMRTVRRWIRWYNCEGTALPKHATGNRHSTWEVNGVDLINLTLFWLVRPKAYLDEVHTYVHNRNPATPPFSLPLKTKYKYWQNKLFILIHYFVLNKLFIGAIWWIFGYIKLYCFIIVYLVRVLLHVKLIPYCL